MSQENPTPLLLELVELIQNKEPDEILGPDDNPYLLRWFIVRSREQGNIYLHRFLRSDDDRALHDHPWSARSFVIEGGYWEHLEDGKVVWRAPGKWAPWFPANHQHRVQLPEGKTALTLFITGPHEREWGFHCPNGWVHWKDFTAPGPKGEGQLSKGCPG